MNEHRGPTVAEAALARIHHIDKQIADLQLAKQMYRARAVKYANSLMTEAEFAATAAEQWQKTPLPSTIDEMVKDYIHRYNEKLTDKDQQVDADEAINLCVHEPHYVLNEGGGDGSLSHMRYLAKYGGVQKVLAALAETYI